MIITAFLKVNNRAYDDYDARISRSNIQITIFDFNFLISYGHNVNTTFICILFLLVFAVNIKEILKIICRFRAEIVF